MMAIDLANRKAETIAVVAAIIVLALVLVAGQYVYRKHQWAEEVLEQVEPRYARLLGLRDSDAALTQAINDARAAMARLGHASARDAAQIGNELQQVLRRAMQSAGLTVSNSQVMPARTEARLERIPVVVQGEGSVAALQLYLAALQGESPMIATENIAVQATGRMAVDGSPLVSVRHTVSVARVGS